MLYKLLRDNVESGPYTKSDLMNMELLSSDFLRPDVEGSKWILANKFTELKNKISETSFTNPENKPKPKYKITADGKMIEVSTEDTVDKKNTSSETKEQNPKETEKKPENIGAKTPQPFKRTPSALPKRKDEDESREKTPFEYQSKSETLSNPTKVATTSVFASETVKQPPKEKKKKAGNIIKEFVIPIAILGGIFLGWSYWNNKTGNGSKETRETLNAMLEDQKGADISTLPSNSATDTSSATITTVPVQMPKTDSVVAHIAPVKKNVDSIALAAAQKKKADSLALARRTAEQEKALAAEKNKAAEKKAEEAKKPAATTTTTAKNTETTDKTPATNTAAATKKGGNVRDYVRLQLNNPAKEGFINAKIKVNNISSSKLDVAVVRVRYLDDKSNVIKSETIQVDNIPAGRSVIVGIPDSKEASKISYGATMISGEDVYIMRK